VINIKYILNNRATKVNIISLLFTTYSNCYENPETKGQRSEVRDQRSEIRGPDGTAFAFHRAKQRSGISNTA